MSSVGQTYQTLAPPPPPQPTPAPMRSTAYDNATTDDIADAFVKNSSQFVDKKTGKVSLEKLMQVGDRKNSGNAASDGITALALAVLQRNLLDGDLIDRSEEFLRTGGRSEKPKESDSKKDLPVGGRGDGLQRHRVESSDKDNGKSNPYLDKTPQELSEHALARFSSLADADGSITDKSLASVASGTRSDGTPASQAEKDLANAILDKGGLFAQFDKGDGKLDGHISRDALDKVINPLRDLSDKDLLDKLNIVFTEFLNACGGKLVNYDILEEAAGQRPSKNSFTSEAQQIARELLSEHRSKLLRDLDNGGDGGDPDRLFHRNNIATLKARLPQS